MIDDLTKLALEVAPELARWPLYVTAPPVGYPALPNLWAFTTYSTDFAIRASLIERGEWRGPGATIVLTDYVLGDMESAVGAMIHEAAHCLPVTAPTPDREPTEEEYNRQVELVGLWAKLPPDEKVLESWDSKHGGAFIRRCLHLRYRASLLGHKVPFPAIQFGGWQYGLSGAWKYARALADEPRKMLDASFEEIESKNLPAEFAKLWQSDTSNTYKQET